jgi:uncharacterized membrane protein
LRIAQRAQLALCVPLLASLMSPSASRGQAKPAAPPAQRNPPVGPPAPQSKHYPILLLAFGNQPNWNVRIGLKGPERFDREGYPPIPLEPAEVTHETAADSWTYHAKDSATGAAVAVHLSREACTDATNDTLTITPPLGGKYSFRVGIEHAQIGSLKGCARVATELFPKINNQPDQDEDDTKKKPPVPVSTVTKFKLPSAVAYLNASQQLVFKQGSVARVIPGKPGTDFSISHDGKKLLFTREEGASGLRSLNLYEFDSNSVKELLRGEVRDAMWSPDDSRVACLNHQDGKWQLWAFPSIEATKAAVLSSDDFDSIQGWSDVHTVLVLRKNPVELAWIGEDGKASQAVSVSDICGPDFRPGTNLTLRMHPSNPDLVVVSAPFTHPPQGVPAGNPGGEAQGLFFYEFRARRRTLLAVPNLSASNPEWSRDGFLVFFTGTDASHRSATYRVFWDGIGQQKYLSASSLVIGL